MRILLFLPMLFLITSCASEAIEFKTKNYLKIYNDELTVKLIPKKNRTKVLLSYYDTIFETNAPQTPRIFRIVKNRKTKTVTNTSLESYNDVINSFRNIDENLLKYPKTGIDSLSNSYVSSPWPDAPSMKITYFDGSNKKVISARGLYEDYGYFYTTSKIILKKANISVDSLITFGTTTRIIK